MQTVRVTRDEEFSDLKPDRFNPLKTDRINFNIYDFEPWQVMPMRRHQRSDSVLLVVEGEGTMYIDDDSFSLEPGEAVYVPAGACYGILAGENDMVITASQGPLPIDTSQGSDLMFRCPACGLDAPVSPDTADQAGTTCPRCEATLVLKREPDRFSATEIGPPEFTRTGPKAGEALPPGAGEATLPKSIGQVPGGEIEETAGEELSEQIGHEAENKGQAARLAFSAFEFEPWQVLPMHQNQGSDTILYIATGQGIMYLNDEEQSVDTGDAVYVPAGSTYGLLAADYPLIAVSVQCPAPVESRTLENLGYNCPICDLGTPVTSNTDTGCITVCPRCNVKLKLTKLEDGFDAEETAEPAPASAETV
jgi:quercetin dioxygenase-like cupin family protein/Zn-finger nucleic acid-binding protein